MKYLFIGRLEVKITPLVREGPLKESREKISGKGPDHPVKKEEPPPYLQESLEGEEPPFPDEFTLSGGCCGE
jgi:hypothetical protein